MNKDQLKEVYDAINRGAGVYYAPPDDSPRRIKRSFGDAHKFAFKIYTYDGADQTIIIAKECNPNQFYIREPMFERQTK